MNRRIQHILLFCTGVLLTSLFGLQNHLMGQPVEIFSNAGESYTNSDGPMMDTYTVNINNCSSISVSMDYSFSLPWEGSGNMETSGECDFGDPCPGDPQNPLEGGCETCWDFLWVRYIVDGTEVMGELVGEAGTTDTEQSGSITLNGYCTSGASQLVIEVVTQTWAMNETVTFSNISVECWDQSPVAEAAPNPICTGNDLQLDETSGNGYSSWSWTGPNGFTAGIQNPVITNFMTGDAGDYIVEVDDPNGCPAKDTVTVMTNPGPSYSTVDLGEVCSDEAMSFDLTVYEDSITTTDPVTFYDGDPSGGGTEISNPSSADLTAVGELWAQVGTGNCTASFMIPFTITPAPQLDPVSDVTACESYPLPPIEGSNLNGLANLGYFTQPNGQGIEFSAGDILFASWDPLYIYAGNANCNDQVSFTLTITDPPSLDPISDTTSCSPVVLPEITGTNLQGTESYWTGSGQTGTNYPEGGTISSSTTLYATSGDPSTNCYDEVQFEVTILDEPQIDPISDVNTCGFYVLPEISGSNLTGNEAYFDMPGGTGNSFSEGDTIFSGTTLYAFDDNGSCSDEVSFSIIITDPPSVNPISDTTSCSPVVLPTISGTNLTGNESYWTGSGQTGTNYPEGGTISSSTTLYATSGDPSTNCYDEVPFEVTILDEPQIDPISDVNTCDFYVLPTISGMNLTGNEAYFDMPGGTGISFSEGDTIFSGTTLYAFDDNGSCSDEVSFSITVSPSEDPGFTFADFCEGAANGPTGIQTPGGTFSFNPDPGDGATIDPATGEIAGESPNTYSVQYITPGSCPDTAVVSVEVFASPQFLDITTICAPDGTSYDIEVDSDGDSLTSSAGTVSNNGGGSFTVSGVPDGMSASLDLFNTATGCSNSMSVTAPDCNCPQIDPIGDTTTCEDFTLPPITGMNLPPGVAYFDMPGGSGTEYGAGDVLTSSATLYAFYDNGSCSDEEPFEVTILDEPQIDPINDVNTCDFYVLPEISGSNLTGNEAYFDMPGGTGISFSEGDTVFGGITLYAFDGNGSCSDEESFSISIPPEENAFFTFDEFCVGAVNGPENIETPGGTFSFNPDPGDGATIDPATGEIAGESPNIYFVQYVTPGMCPDTAVVAVEVFAQPEFINVTTICNTDGSYDIELSSDGDELSSTAGAVVNLGSGDFIVENVPAGMDVTLELTNTTTGCSNTFSVTAPDCNCPQIDPIDDTTACEQYVLPDITGDPGLPSSIGYFDASGGGGTEYAPGDIISTSLTLYAFYDDGDCMAEEAFDINIIEQPQIDPIQDITACESFTLPSIEGDNLNDPAYYTNPGGSGTTFEEGEVITTTTILHAYDGIPNCNDEESFQLTIIPSGNASFTFDDFCEEAMNGPMDVSPPGGTFSFNPPPGDGAAIDPVSGEIFNETPNIYSVRYISPGMCPDTVVQQVEVLETPTIEDFTYECDSSGDTYSVEVESDGNDLTTTVGSVMPQGSGTFIVTNIPAGSSAVLTVLNNNGCFTRLTTSPQECDCAELFPISDKSECDFYILPEIIGPNTTTNAAYYTQPNGMGMKYEVGDTIFTDTSLYAYDIIDTCSDEVNFEIEIQDSEDASFTFDDFCEGSMNGPMDISPSGGTFSFNPPPGDGAVIDPMTGEISGETPNTYSVQYVTPGTCPDTFLRTVEVFALPQLNVLQSSCDSTGTTYRLLIEYSGGDSSLSASTGTITPVGEDSAFIRTIPIDSSLTLTMISVSGCTSSFTIDPPNCDCPEIDFIPDTTVCGRYILPSIPGSNLPGNVAYYSEPGGGGIQFIQGDTIEQTDTLYAYYSVNNCEDEESFEVTIDLGPEINMPDTIFGCSEVILPPIDIDPSSAASNYFTMPGGNGIAFNAGDTIDSTTTLYIYAEEQGGCIAEQEVVAAVNSGPELAEVADTTACGEFVLPNIEGMNLTGDAAFFTDTSGTGDSFQPGDTITGDMTLYIHDNLGGCSDQVMFEITVEDIPDPEPLYNIPVCEGDSLFLFSNVDVSSWSYSWSGPNGFNSSEDMPLVTGTANLSNEGIYHVVVDNGSCLSDSIPLDVEIIEQFPYAVSDTTICNATSSMNLYDVFGIPDSIGQWSGPSVSADTLIASLIPGVYGVEFTTTGYCENNYSITLQLVSNQNRTQYITPDVCTEDSILIDGNYYSATNPTDTLVVSGASIFDCDSLTIINLNILQPDTTMINSSLCSGDSMVIDGTVYDENNPAGMEILEGQTVTGCDSVIIVDLDIQNTVNVEIEDTLCSGDSMLINGTVYNEANPAGTEILEGQAANGCDSVLDISLTFSESISENITPSICSGDTVFVNGTAYFDGNANGQEIIPGGSQSGCDSVINVNLMVNETDTTFFEETLCTGEVMVIDGTTYDASNPSGIEVLEGQAANGCDSVLIIDLNFDSLEIAFSTDQPTCQQPSSGGLTIESVNTGRFDLELVGIDTLSGVMAPLFIDQLSPGIYSGNIIDASGACNSTFTFEIEEFEPIELSLGPDIETEQGETILLNANVNFDPQQVIWSPAFITDCDTCTQITINPTADLTVTATAIAGDTSVACSVSDTLFIRVEQSRDVYIPNAFTPNNDGINELFSVYSGENIRSINTLRIFNRWGDLVYEKLNASPDPSTHGWDGTFNNQKLNPGVFVYTIEVEFQDGTTRLYNGEVTLIR